MTGKTIEEDRKFLIVQRKKNRRGLLARPDIALSAREERSRERLQKQRRRRDQTIEESGPSCMAVLVSSSFSRFSSGAVDRNEIKPVIAFKSTLPSKRWPKNIVTKSLGASLDRTKTDKLYSY